MVWPKRVCFLFPLPAPFIVSSMCPADTSSSRPAHLGHQLPSCRSGSVSYVSALTLTVQKQLCETHALTPPFTGRETKAQRACALGYRASNWLILHLNDFKAPALSAAICCPGLDLSPALCMFCWISSMLEMQDSPCPQEGLVLQNSHPLLGYVTDPTPHRQRCYRCHLI